MMRVGCATTDRWRVFKLLAVAILAIAAAALICVHLQLPHNTTATVLMASSAAARTGERMPMERPSGNVNVNTANADELCTLHGIGPELAQRIIEERETHGAFYYPADLLGVNGIGQKTLDRLLPEICLD